MTSGRIALITGASSGLGARFAAQLAKEPGMALVLGARRMDRLNTLVAQIQAQGGKALAVDLDVTSEPSIRAAFDAAEQAFGTPQIVIANAGIGDAVRAIDMPVEAFDALMQVNVRGVFLTVREAAARMIAAGHGARKEARIVLTASMAGLRPLAGLSAYSISKAAVVMMARSLALEWARDGINVNAICPGYIKTEINADWFETPGGQRQVQRFPRGALMEEDALDDALAFLTSPSARHVTGSVVSVDDAQGL